MLEMDVRTVLATFALTLIVLMVLHPFAARLNLLDHPRGRKDHREPTPVTGGLAMAVGCLVVMFGMQASTRPLLAFTAAALLLVAVGVADDIWDVRWYWRILAQVAAALLLIYVGGVRIQELGHVFGLDRVTLGVLSVPFTIFATVGIINAVNMIDGADGLAGLLSLAAMVMLVAAALYAGNVALASRLSVLCGALAAFLLWNIRLPWRPHAKVFMGNAGSAFLGLVFAWVTFRLTQNPGHPVNPVLALWLLPIPVMDCLVLLARRLREGRSPFSAGRDHIHHIMQDAGFSTMRMGCVLAGFSLLCGLAAGEAMRLDIPNPLILLAYLGMCVGWYLLTLDRQRAIRFFRVLGGPVVGRLSVPESTE